MSEILTAHPASQASHSRAGKYLTFLLGNEEFGIGVLDVREIIEMQEITAVPRSLPYIKGVINLRGKLIPVVDLRLKFGMPAAPYTPRTCIVVVLVAGEAGRLMMGVIVDGVVEVLNLGAGDVEDVPDFAAAEPSPYLLGMAKVKGKVKILLDIHRVLTCQEVTDIQSAVRAS